MPTIFYSWQSDLPNRLNRGLVERALEKAVKALGNEIPIELVIDQDLRDTPGSEIIADGIQQKIRNALAVVADLSIVARREDGGGLPNGCVSIEWGWAEQALGSGALVGVMNTAFGTASDLPIDIRQRLVRCFYSAADGDSAEALAEARRALAERLATELRATVTGRYFRGFGPEAPAIICHLVRASADGLRSQGFTAPQLARASGGSEQAAEATMEDLLRFGLVEEQGYLGSGLRVCCQPAFYAYFDPLFVGWNADRDATALAAELLTRESWDTLALAKKLAWQPRRLNPALFRLLQGGFADASNEVPGPKPVYRVMIMRNAATRALAERRAAFPSIAPRASPQPG